MGFFRADTLPGQKTPSLGSPTPDKDETDAVDVGESSEFLNLEAAVTVPVSSSTQQKPSTESFTTKTAAQQAVKAGMPQFMQNKANEKHSSSNTVVDKKSDPVKALDVG